jgi:hypothetical protein
MGRVIVGVPAKVRTIGTANGEKGSYTVLSVVPSGLKNNVLEETEGQLLRSTRNGPVDVVFKYAADVPRNIPSIFLVAVGVQADRPVAAKDVAPANMEFMEDTLETFQLDIF